MVRYKLNDKDINRDRLINRLMRYGFFSLINKFWNSN